MSPGPGAAAQDLLVSDGYKAPQPAADAPGSSGVKKTTVYYRDDENAAQNQADATYIADTYFDGAQVKTLDPSFDRRRAGRASRSWSSSARTSPPTLAA